MQLAGMIWWRQLPWSVKVYGLFVTLVLACLWAVTKPVLYQPMAVFTMFYIGMALGFVLSRNDWVRFGITGFHLLLAALLIFLIVVVIPGMNVSPLYPWRCALILGACAGNVLLLWHPATGRWVMAR